MDPKAGQSVTLVDYDPAWPARYSMLEEEIRAALGDSVLQIAHVGSTSVPGLIARPVIDLHVFSAGCPEVDRMLRFRDRLRSDPGDRELYASTKRQLAARQWRDVQDYADAKNDVIDEIAARAAATPRTGSGATGRC